MTGWGDDLSDRILVLKDLKMVNCYQIFEESGSVNGIMAYYKGGVINLCSTEKGYEELFDKVARVYAEESKKHMIVADESTRKILEGTWENSGSAIAKRLEAFEETKTPCFLPKAFSHYQVLPIVRYLLELFTGDREGAIKLDAKTRDWYGRGEFGGLCQGKRLHFPYRIDQRRIFVFDVTVCNVLKTGDCFRFRISFGREGILASFQEDYFLYQGDLILRFCEGQAVLSCRIRQGESIYLAREDRCEKRDRMPSELTRKICSENELQWLAFVLPWGDEVFQAWEKGEEYLVYSFGQEDLTISQGMVSKRLTANGDPEIWHGLYAFRLFERERLSELQLLDLEYPRNYAFAERYSGKFYVKNQQ